MPKKTAKRLTEQRIETTRTGWGLKAGDVVQRHDYGTGTYEVLNVFRGYDGGGWLAIIRGCDGTQQTVPAGSVYTV